jgi:hypothetical protein
MTWAYPPEKKEPMPWECKSKPPKSPPTVDLADQISVIIIGIATFSRTNNS